MSKADMVLFHAPKHNSVPPKSSFKGEKPLFTLISLEQPKYATILQDFRTLQRDFDLLATYSLQDTYPGTSVPNLPLTYYPLHIIPPKSIQQPPRKFSEKTGFGTGTYGSLVYACIL
jgi:hypothetical protein